MVPSDPWEGPAAGVVGQSYSRKAGPAEVGELVTNRPCAGVQLVEQILTVLGLQSEVITSRTP